MTLGRKNFKSQRKVAQERIRITVRNKTKTYTANTKTKVPRESEMREISPVELLFRQKTRKERKERKKEQK